MPVTSINKITDQALDRYDVVDQLLIPSQSFLRNFNTSTDYIEAHIYTQNDVLLSSDYNVTIYTLPQSEGNSTNQIIFDPGTYLTSQKYNVGDFKVDYRIYRKQIFTLSSPTFFISEISTDRTEIRLSSNIVSNDTIETNTLNFIHQMQSSVYYKDFLLNFGENKVVNAVNIALDKNTVPFSLLIKLYQPLPTEFSVKAPLWIVEELSSPIIFEVVLTPDFTAPVTPMLSGANFDVDVNAHHSLASPYVNQSNIYSTGTLEQYQNILNQLNNDSINVNVDYTNYSDFVHFSSVAQRLVNFQYKLTQIENYGLDIATLNTIPNQDTVVSGSAQGMQSSINALIQNMDGYESYLYNVSSSYAWPKSGSILYSVTSSQALNWLGDNQTTGQLYSASLYDLENQDNLIYTIPSYLADDPNNSDYLLFVNMLGQHYDSIWIYIKAINDIHKADNNLNKGISKDMVYTALRSLGVKLYNNNSNQDLPTYLVGNVSSSYTVTGSGIPMSGEDQTKEIYKRIYHNLPYLLKSKGTIRGLQNLISIYGIPDTVLSPIEYGGSDKSSATPEYIYDRFSYSLSNVTGSYVQLIWGPLTQNYQKYSVTTQVPDAVEFRIKVDKNIKLNNATLIQVFRNTTTNSYINWGVTLNYTSSQNIPSANFNLIMSGSSGYVSSSLCLPVYATGSDGNTSYYNVLVTKALKNTSYGHDNTYTLYVQNCISGRVGQQASASLSSGVSLSPLSWDYYGSPSSSFTTVGSAHITNSIFSSSFVGQIQELRYWSEPVQKSTFDTHTLSNESIQGNSLTSSYADLAARFPLGNDLLTYNHSIKAALESVHPAHNTSYIYAGGNNAIFYKYPNTNNYQSEYELVYSSSPNAGYYSPVTDKIRIIDNTPLSSVLSPFLKLETPDSYRTNDTHYTEISLSPQNEINKDVIAQYGDVLDLDQYIGNPLYQQYSAYPDVVLLNNQYRQKFISKFNYRDFVNLAEQLDNTLFKMLTDFIPARTNLSTGITIKSPILERNKIPRNQPSIIVNQFTASVGHNTIHAGTSFSKFNEEMTFMTGDLTGSFVDIHDNFEVRNYNPYLSFDQSINKNSFNHSDFDVTCGDVYSNRKSNLYMKLDPNNSFISQSVSLQDSEYNHSRWNIPRYFGSKVSVSKLNVYTPGDIGYGTVPNINRNSGKFAWVKSISNISLNFYDKTQVNIYYLVNASGSLTELNKNNNNIFEIQNIFKSGTNAVLSISDVNNPSNQRKINGAHTVWKGGYSYDPLIYRNNESVMSFISDNPYSSTVYTTGFIVTNESLYDYNWVKTNIYNVLSSDTNSRPYLKVGGSAVNSGKYIYSNIYNSPFSSGTSINPTYDTWPYQGLDPRLTTVTAADSPPILNVNFINFNDFNIAQNLGYNSFFNGLTAGFNTEPDPSVIMSNVYKVPRTSTYTINACIAGTYIQGNEWDDNHLGAITMAVEITDEFGFNTNTWIDIASSTQGNLAIAYTVYSNAIGPITLDIYQNQNNIFQTSGHSNTSVDFNCTLTSNGTDNKWLYNLSEGQYIKLSFFLLDMGSFGRADDGRLIINKDTTFFSVTDILSQKVVYNYTSSYNSYDPFFTLQTTYSTNDTLRFNSLASSYFYSSSYVDTLAGVEYTPVVDILDVQPYDIVRIGEFKNPKSVYYTVSKVIDNRPDHIDVVLDSPVLFSGANPTQDFAILRPKLDETSVILDVRKLNGDVAQSVLIPYDLDSNVQKEIGDIIKQIKTYI